MIENFDELARAFHDLTHGKTVEEVKALRDGRDPAVRRLTMLFRTYIRAQTSALSFGYIGVGCITFAELRMMQAQQRLDRKG